MVIYKLRLQIKLLHRTDSMVVGMSLEDYKLVHNLWLPITQKGLTLKPIP